MNDIIRSLKSFLKCRKIRINNRHSADFVHKQTRKRAVKKNGDCAVEYLNLTRRKKLYLQDFYTTLVDTRWRWTLLAFFVSFIVCWSFFGIIYYSIMRLHRDNEPSQEGEEARVPCLQNVQTFTASFLLSLETQHTIGYGFRYVTEECPEAVITLCFQSICGVMIQAFMVGVVFAKLTRPKTRLNTLMFSKCATVSYRNGKLCLMFRVADMRKSFIIGTTVQAQLIRQRVTAEGERIPFYQEKVVVTSEGGAENLFFIWPLTIVHVIDEESPFFGMSAKQLANDDFELVVYLDGTTESTGMVMQARYSYVPNNILWGHRFSNIISYNPDSGNYSVDFSLFNSTSEVATPLCSADELDVLQQASSTQRFVCYKSTSSSSDTAIYIEPEHHM